MRKTLLVLGSLAVLMLAGIATPRDVLAGCSCDCGCVYSKNNTHGCEPSPTSCLCTTGYSYPECKAPETDVGLELDGTISGDGVIVTRVADGESLTRRSCDESVIRRQYSAAAAQELKLRTATIHV